jgi:peptide/nickel transport system permease protein
MFLLVVAVICFNFFLFRLPTLVLGVSPVDVMISPELRRDLTRDVLEGLYLRFGLVPDPDIFDWIYMFWRYMVNMFSGNFGLSFISQRPVMDELMARLPNTLLLMGTSSIVSIGLGIWTGVKVAADPGSRKDVSAVTVALFIYALPIFWLGMLLLMVFSVYIPALTGGLITFPLGGTLDYPVWIAAKDNPLGALVIAGNILHHLVLPMIALGVGGYGGYST